MRTGDDDGDLFAGTCRATRPGMKLLIALGVLDRTAQTVNPLDPARFADQPDEWWARICYALALFIELYRASNVEGSRLMRLSATSSFSDVMGLATDNEVADMTAMRDLAVTELLPRLPAGAAVTSGMSFEGSDDLKADADLIPGGILVDFKASQGGSPRKDGTGVSDSCTSRGPPGTARTRRRPRPTDTAPSRRQLRPEVHRLLRFRRELHIPRDPRLTAPARIRGPPFGQIQAVADERVPAHGGVRRARGPGRVRRRSRGNRRVPYRGVTKNDAWIHHRVAALNLRRLITLGLSDHNGSWALITA